MTLCASLASGEDEAPLFQKGLANCDASFPAPSGNCLYLAQKFDRSKPKVISSSAPDLAKKKISASS